MPRRLTRRVWEGIGLIVFGAVFAFFTVFTVVGPIVGIGFVLLGVFLIVWTTRRDRRAKRP